MQNCLFCLFREINFLNSPTKLTCSSICYFISRISALITEIHLHFDNRMPFLYITMRAWNFLEFPAWSSPRVGEFMLWRIDMGSKSCPTVIRADEWNRYLILSKIEVRFQKLLTRGTSASNHVTCLTMKLKLFHGIFSWKKNYNFSSWNSNNIPQRHCPSDIEWT